MSTGKGPSAGDVVGVVVVGGLALAGVAVLARLLGGEDPERRRLRARVQEALTKAARTLGVPVPRLLEDRRHDRNAWSDGVSIGWNPMFFEKVLARHCTDTACQESIVLGIMGHELGHHVREHAVGVDVPSHVKELDADAIAGHILGRAGVEPHHFEEVLLELSLEGSPTHPVGWRRAETVRAAFERARGWWA